MNHRNDNNTYYNPEFILYDQLFYDGSGKRLIKRLHYFKNLLKFPTSGANHPLGWSRNVSFFCL